MIRQKVHPVNELFERKFLTTSTHSEMPGQRHYARDSTHLSHYFYKSFERYVHENRRKLLKNLFTGNIICFRKKKRRQLFMTSVLLHTMALATQNKVNHM